MRPQFQQMMAGGDDGFLYPDTRYSFIMTVRADDGHVRLRLYVLGLSSESATIDWGDGSSTTVSTVSSTSGITHTYAAGRTYVVRAVGVPRIAFSSSSGTTVGSACRVDTVYLLPWRGFSRMSNLAARTLYLWNDLYQVGDCPVDVAEHIESISTNADDNAYSKGLVRGDLVRTIRLPMLGDQTGTRYHVEAMFRFCYRLKTLYIPRIKHLTGNMLNREASGVDVYVDRPETIHTRAFYSDYENSGDRYGRRWESGGCTVNLHCRGMTFLEFVSAFGRTRHGAQYLKVFCSDITFEAVESDQYVIEKFWRTDSGRPCDSNGRLVNDLGQLIDEDGNTVDRDGNPVVWFAGEAYPCDDKGRIVGGDGRLRAPRDAKGVMFLADETSRMVLETGEYARGVTYRDLGGGWLEPERIELTDLYGLNTTGRLLPVGTVARDQGRDFWQPVDSGTVLDAVLQQWEHAQLFCRDDADLSGPFVVYAIDGTVACRVDNWDGLYEEVSVHE